jgi:hypothetical protein
MKDTIGPAIGSRRRAALIAALAIVLAAVAVPAAGSVRSSDGYSLSLWAPARWVVAKSFVVNGGISPVLADREISIEELRSGAWSRVAGGRTDADGKYRVRVPAFPAPKTVSLRARFTGDESTTPEPTSGPLASVSRKVIVRYVTLRSVGDVNLGDGVATRLSSHGVDYPWRKVGAFLRAADIAFGNLECCISRRGTPQAKTYTFRGSPAALVAAGKKGGLDVVSLANNHARDFGVGAFKDTLKYLDRYRISHVGGGLDLARAHQPAILERDGLKVAFLAYSTIEDDRWGATKKVPGVASAFPVSRMRRDIAAARKGADLVVVSFHWGIELAPSPEREQISLGRAAIDAGAKIVLGHHPHRLQPMARYHGGLIVYSLGNFVFAPPSTTEVNKQTLVLTTLLSGKGLASYSTRKAYISDAQPHFVK